PDDEKGERSFDGLAWVDDIILAWRTGTATETGLDARVRPHQLFLTGDQIYADDVSSVMLPMLNRVGNTLIGGSVGPELLPTRYRRAPRRSTTTPRRRRTSARPSRWASRRSRPSSRTASRTRRRTR